MHKESHRIREEYQEDSHSHSNKNERHPVRRRDDVSQQKGVARKSQWIFGNLFECLSGKEECTHGRIPFGGIDYCVWPLKDTSVDFQHRPPCMWNAEQD